MKKRPPASRARKARRRPAAQARPARGSGGRGGVLKLPAQCTLADAEGFKLRLTKLLKSVKPVTVDARAVRRIDTASMQLLAAFALQRGANDLAMKVSAASAEFELATRLLGLDRLLPGVAPPAAEGAP